MITGFIPGKLGRHTVNILKIISTFCIKIIFIYIPIIFNPKITFISNPISKVLLCVVLFLKSSETQKKKYAIKYTYENGTQYFVHINILIIY